MRGRGEEAGFRHVYSSFLLAPQAEVFIQEKTAMSMKKTMKLMSWNVGKPSKDTMLAYYPKIKDENVDILALQEVSSDTVKPIKEGLSKIGLTHIETSCTLAVASGLPTGPHRNGKITDGVLIASRWPLELIPEFFRKIPWQKSALSTVVETPYGEIEFHTVHVPNASSSGRWEERTSGDWNYEKKGTTATKRRGRQIKVHTFKGIHAALSTPTVSNRHRILCGDFNSPKKEEQRNGNISITCFGDNDDHRRSEEQVLSGLAEAEYDLADAYSNETFGYSFVYNNGTQRRLDHIFSSSSLNPIECDYLHSFREGKKNKHAAVYAVYKPKLLRLPIKKKR